MIQFPLTVVASAETQTATNLLVTGFFFVVLVLSLLALLTWLVGKVFTKATPAEAPAAPKAPRAADLVQEREAEDGRIAAVITAAVHLAVGDRHFRVRSIRQSTPGWAQEGRRQIFSSHRVR